MADSELMEVMEISSTETVEMTDITTRRLPHPLFGIPELVRSLLMQIDSPASVAQCARVNRLWSEEALAVLWYGDHRSGSEWRTPELEFLAPFARDHPDRFKNYVGKIEYLTIFPDPRKPTTFVNCNQLFAPELWSSFRGQYVKLDIEHQTLHQVHVQSVLNKELQQLYLHNINYSETILEDLEQASPKLSKLTMGDAASSQLDTDALLKYLKGSQMRVLFLKEQYKNCIDTETLEQLLTIPSLETLNLSQVPMQYRVLQYLRLPKSLSLKSLWLTVNNTKPLRRLIYHLPHIETFAIKVNGSVGDIDGDILEPLAISCHQLSCLRLKASQLSLDGRLLAKLAKVTPEMQTLLWNCDDSSRSIASNLCEMASHWPLMHNIMVYDDIGEGDLTAQDLFNIGRSCPKLQRLILVGSITPLDFMELISSCEESGPVFPSLRDLDLGWRLFCPEAEAADFFVKQNEVTLMQSFDFEDTMYDETVVEVTGVRKALAPHAVPLIASRLENALLTMMPNLRVFRSFEIRHMADFPTRFEADAHDRVLFDLRRRFDERCPPARCDLRGWCECWRVIQDS